MRHFRSILIVFFWGLSVPSAHASWWDIPATRDPEPRHTSRSIPERNDLEEVIDAFGFTAQDSKDLRDALEALGQRHISPVLNYGITPAKTAQAYQAANPMALPNHFIPIWYGYLMNLQHTHEGSRGASHLSQSMVLGAIRGIFPGPVGKMLERFHEELNKRLRRPPSHWTARQQDEIVRRLLAGEIPAGPEREKAVYEFARYAKDHPKWPVLARHFFLSNDPSERMMMYNALTWYDVFPPKVRGALTNLIKGRGETAVLPQRALDFAHTCRVDFSHVPHPPTEKKR